MQARLRHEAVTQPVRAIYHAPAYPPPAGATVPVPRRTPVPPRQQPERRSSKKWWLIAPAAIMAALFMSTCAALTLGIGLIYGQGILPQVHAAGIHLGGLSEAEAASMLRSEWDSLILRDGDRTWSFHPELLGITLDADTTARAAYAQGRNEGSPLTAAFGGVDVAPVISIDLVMATVTLDDLAPQFDIAPVNAGVRLVSGQVEATLPQEGRSLDVVKLVTQLENNLEQEIADGVLDLPMLRIAPTVIDASPMIAMASELLANPLQITAFDPIDNHQQNWSLPPEQWSQWLTAAPDANSPIGMALTLEDSGLRGYLNTQRGTLSGPQYIELDDAVQTVQDAISKRRTQAYVRIRHQDTQHTVQPGETITSIAWDYGVPYPWIQQANPGVGDTLSVGQAVTIPSADNFFDYPVVPNKRIVVSISEQRTRVYENGQIKWDWVASTGINSSPTWPGVYQVISHVPNAFAANWNLYMPDFMGVYRPIPGQDFTNGFHGFPTRGGSQLLWTNNLGTRVTYGCILLSSENARLLYEWAEEGVVVEITP